MENNRTPWEVRLITPNRMQAQECYESWIERGYSSHFSKSGNGLLVDIKRSGPSKSLYCVRTRYRAPQ